MAEEVLKKDLSLTRSKFKASKEIRDVMTHNLDFSRKSLAAASKSLVTEDDEDWLLNSLRHLEKQGQCLGAPPLMVGRYGRRPSRV